MKIAVVHDFVTSGAGQDALDTLIQAETVSRVLTELGHQASPVPFTLDLEAARRILSDMAPDVVFNLVEATEGRGGLIHLAPALYELLGIPYTGSDAAALFTTSHKPLMKRLLVSEDLPTPGWVDRSTLAERLPHLEERYILKPVCEHASIGIEASSVIRPGAPLNLLKTLDQQREKEGIDFFAEHYIEGREFTTAFLADTAAAQALPPAEIVFAEKRRGRPNVVGYKAKWDETSPAWRNTHRRLEFPAEDRELLSELVFLSRRCWKLFQLQGYARIDFRVDRKGKPHIIDINANPCLSLDAGFAAQVDHAAIPYATAIQRILASAFRNNSGATAGSTSCSAPKSAPCPPAAISLA